MGVAVGIDLGTTNSAVAWVDSRGTPAVLPNADGQLITPSVICFQGRRVVVGDEAKELQAAGAEDVAAFFKRQMGDPHFTFYAQGRDHSATDLSALVLGQVKRDAEAALGRTVVSAVITVPAYFRNPQREATRDAGRLAGLEVLQLVNEPTAAAIAYGMRQGAKDSGRKLLVYDLGGGTFDLTLLRIDQDEIRILTSEGDHELGGKDWDDRIVQFAASRFEEEFGVNPIADAVSLTDLLARAEQAKKQLTTSLSARISLTHDGSRGTYELDRPTFAAITADLMERSVTLTRKVLDQSRVRPGDLDGILLVGGSTRMPMVHEFITRTFGRPPMTGINVDEAVALGAAVLAAEASPDKTASRFFVGGGRRRTVDVTNHSLGMIALNDKCSAYVNSIILPKNEPVPCEQTRPYQFRTRSRGDNRLEIFMTQGESQAPGDVTYLGQYVIQTMAHAAGGLAVIDIAYAYDASGTVKVAARLRDGGQELPVTVEPLPADVPARFLQPPPPLPEPAHVTAYLVFDLSGSMSSQPLAEAKRAGLSFVQNCDLSHCSIGVMVVADSVRTVLSACQDGRQIVAAINGLEIGMVGYCNAAHPFDEALSRLKGVKDPRYVIALADGVWENQAAAITAARICHQQGIDIIAIGFGSADHAFLKAVASSDQASFMTSLEGLVDTFTTIAQVLTETAGGTEAAGAGGGSGGRPTGGLLGWLSSPRRR